jgi:hypothetical protein
MASATAGFTESAATLGAVAAVETTNSVPVQQKPTGTTRGDPSRAVYAR